MTTKQHTLADIAEALKDHDRGCAPGSESGQWQAFCEDARRQYGRPPYRGDADEVAVDDDFAAYWLAIAAHDWDTASGIGEVPEHWPADCKPKRGRPRVPDEDKAVKISITLPPETLAYVDDVAERGQTTRSGAVRVLLADAPRATEGEGGEDEGTPPSKAAKS